ncbi:hypothetical protein IFM61606_07175 [Aspergillus udagawae]|nr:hypothetical protein IFM61606_07175 [Aspergillus udagawae]
MGSNLSLRGRTLAAQKPAFLDVLGDIWDPSSNPDGVVNIGLAENTLMHLEMREFMNSKLQVDSHALTYGDGFSGSHKLKGALCHFLNRHFCPRVALSPSQITITSGVSNAVECCAWALADPGDYILIGRPYFNAFKPTFGIRAGYSNLVGLLEVKFGMTDPFSLDAVQEYEKTYVEARRRGICVKALLLCSPHNPLGRCYSEDVLREYMKFCNKHRLHLISDEIYALSVWEKNDLSGAPTFKSVLSMDIGDIMDRSMVHVVWGLSKDFGATGLRIGCLISQSNMSLLEAADGISLYNFPSSLADSIAASILLDDEFGSKYIATNQRRLAESYRFVTDFLTLHGIPYYKSNAAIFVWMNLAAVLRDKSIKDADILRELRSQKVYIAAGYAYASEEAGWFRMVFAHSQSVLEEGLNPTYENSEEVLFSAPADSPAEWKDIVVEDFEAYRHISLQDKCATGPYTTLFYNEIDPADPGGQQRRPVWKVEPNSIIVRPLPRAVFESGHTITVIGRAWACDEIVQVEISTDGGNSWCNAQLTPRREFEWQLFQQRVVFSRGGFYTITARATDKRGQQQPLYNRRNHVPTRKKLYELFRNCVDFKRRLERQPARYNFSNTSSGHRFISGAMQSVTGQEGEGAVVEFCLWPALWKGDVLVYPDTVWSKMDEGFVKDSNPGRETATIPQDEVGVSSQIQGSFRIHLQTHRVLE